MLKMRKLVESKYTMDIDEFEIDKNNPLNNQRKQNIIHKLYRYESIKKMKGFFSDDSWEPIHNFMSEMQKQNIDIYIQDTEYQKENGIPVRKIWKCVIPFINQNNKKDVIYCDIIAAGAGSVDDPLDRYDVTIVLS